MGRVFLLLAGAIIFGCSFLIFDGQQSTFETRQNQSDHQFKGIATSVVTSGFDHGVAAIKRDLMNTPTTFERVTMGDGYYEVQVSKGLYGDLDIAVNAHSGGAEFDMQGNVLFTAAFPAALMLEDDGVLVSGSGFYQVSGVDRRMPSRGNGGGFDTPVRGIITTESHVNEVNNSLIMDRIVGLGSDPTTPINAGSVVGGFSEAEVEAFYQEAKLASHAVLSGGPEGVVSENSLLSAISGSSPGNPKIIRAMGDLTITEPVQGYGMLIVEDGDLNIFSPSFDWEGLIMVRKQDKDTVQVDLRNTTVHGAVVAYDFDGVGMHVECVPDFDIIGDEAIVNVPFKVRVEVLGAAISASGEYDMPVTARVHVGEDTYEPWGDYHRALDGNVNTGNSGVTYMWEPNTIFEAGSAISIDGRSWIRKEDRDGDEEDDWLVHMEEQSTTAGPQIYLLGDGSAVPNVGGFMGQYSVVDFLDTYIESNQLKLEANQAISLFEVGVTDPVSGAFDLQDLVVLVTMIDASDDVCYAEGAPSTLDFSLHNGAKIHYSTEAIAKLGLHLGSIRDNTSVRVARSALHGHGSRETLAFQTNVVSDDHEGADAEAPAGSAMVSVCHNDQTRVIPHPVLGAHIAHGDYMGTCVGTP